MFKSIILVITLSLSSFGASSNNNLDNIEMLGLIIDDMKIEGVLDDKVYFEKFDTFLKLKSLIEDISKKPIMESSNEDILLEFDVYYFDESIYDEVIKFSKSLMIYKDQFYSISDGQFKELKRLLMFRMTEQEFNTLISQ